MQLSKKSIFTAACAAALLLTGSVHAAQTSSLNITGTVLAECKFTGGPYAMPFGNLTPSANADATQVVTIGYQCTNGTAATSIKINAAASPTTVNISSGANNLPVHLTWTTAATAGTGIGGAFPVISVPVTGTILAADIAGAVAGVYIASYNIDLLP